MIPLVLSIDDDRNSQIIMEAYLKDVDFCHAFVAKENGQEALDYLISLIQDSKPTLWPTIIFLDINMPVLDGWGFLDSFSLVANRFEKLPAIVMVSATNTPEDIDRATNHPLVTQLVTKPVNSTELDRLRTSPELRHYFADSYSPLTSNYSASL